MNNDTLSGSKTLVLSDFIVENMEAIVDEWQAFAATLLPVAAKMTPLALRNHAEHILHAVAKDLTTTQTKVAQARKSKGGVPIASSAPETAAQTHAVLRARSGFDINQLVAEYRALRASVLRLCSEAHPNVKLRVEDLIRFNEAIDQAVAESVGHFHMQITQARNLFLGMLGHDMRTPLQSIVTTASYLAGLNAGEPVTEAAMRLIRSGASMQALLNDLRDFNRTQLGLGIQVTPTEIDLETELRDEVELLRDAHPERDIELEVSDETHGLWDGVRLRQMLRNLVENAVDHGFADTPVQIRLAGGDEIRLEVSNEGPAIDPAARAEMFDPLKRGSDEAGNRTENLGLGLFVVREVARAHGGDVDVRSEDGMTTFIVLLPHRTTAES